MNKHSTACVGLLLALCCLALVFFVFKSVTFFMQNEVMKLLNEKQQGLANSNYFFLYLFCLFFLPILILKYNCKCCYSQKKVNRVNWQTENVFLLLCRQNNYNLAKKNNIKKIAQLIIIKTFSIYFL